MKKLIISLLMILLLSCPVFAVMDGQGDYQTDEYGYYYVITGGKFINGQTVNGQKNTGGSMAFIVDDPIWQTWGYNYAIDTWHKDGWFAETAGLALTMKNQSSIVYDNFNNDAGNFYTCPPGGQASGDTPGLYRGYSMSNNLDWIYAGYFKLTEETTITEITGYFDETAGFDADNSILNYRMNIWSNVDVDKGTYIQKTPGVVSFTGDIFSSDYVAGTFNWGDTGVDRIFGDDYSNQHDDILYLTYTLSTPIVLQPGEYWFSHDATVPEPATIGLLAFGALSLLRRKK